MANINTNLVSSIIKSNMSDEEKELLLYSLMNKENRPTSQLDKLPSSVQIEQLPLPLAGYLPLPNMLNGIRQYQPSHHQMLQHPSHQMLQPPLHQMMQFMPVEFNPSVNLNKIESKDTNVEKSKSANVEKSKKESIKVNKYKKPEVKSFVKSTTNSENYIQNNISDDVINNVKKGSDDYKNFILEIVEKIEKDTDLEEQYKFIQENFYGYENWKLWHYGPLKKNGSQNLRVYKENDIELGFSQAQQILKERGLKLLDISDPAVNTKAVRIVLGSLKHEFNQEKETLWHGFNKLK